MQICGKSRSLASLISADISRDEAGPRFPSGPKITNL